MNIIERNKNIYNEFIEGTSVQKLQEKYKLSYNTILIIIRDNKSKARSNDVLCELADFIDDKNLAIANALIKRGINLDKLK